MFMDWDIGADPSVNQPGYDSELSLGYVYDPSTQVYGGVAVLGKNVVPAYRSIDNPSEIYPEAGDYTDAKKWSHLSRGVQSILKSTPSDYSQVLGAGPFNINAGDTAVVGFAIIAGSSLDELKSGCVAARDQWRRLMDTTWVNSVAEFRLEPVFPNPFRTQTHIRYWMPRAANVRITVHDVTGRELVCLMDKNQPATPVGAPHELNWDGRTKAGEAASGVYLIRCQAGNLAQVQKTVFIR
jgi:hypothetical protein